MTQVRKNPPRTPRHAAARAGPIDAGLDPALFKALADPTRVRLLGCLAKCARACTVTEIAECCDVDFSVVSRHLQLLDRAGIVASARAGRSVSYAVRYRDLSLALRRLADALDACIPAASRHTCTGACCADD